MKNDLSIKKRNDFVLRPRFKLELPINKDKILKAFENTQNTQDKFIVNRIDDHVFIKFPKAEQQFWTPQLHLEINNIEDEENLSILYGLFGPNPTVWLMFIFLHLVIGVTFLGFAIWCYTNWSLGNPFTLQLIIMILMVILWITFYVMGRIGRHTTKKEMLKLYSFMTSVLETI